VLIPPALKLRKAASMNEKGKDLEKKDRIVGERIRRSATKKKGVFWVFEGDWVS